MYVQVYFQLSPTILWHMDKIYETAESEKSGIER